MDPAVWQEQIAMYGRTGPVPREAPKVDDVMTMDVLKATRAARLKV